MNIDKSAGQEPEENGNNKLIEPHIEAGEGELKITAPKKPENVVIGGKMDAKEQKELETFIINQHRVNFVKYLPFYLKLILIFLFLLFFVTLPLSVLNLEFEGVLQFLQNYSIAIVETGATIFTVIATIAVPYAIKWLYGLVRQQQTDDDKRKGS